MARGRLVRRIGWERVAVGPGTRISVRLPTVGERAAVNAAAFVPVIAVTPPGGPERLYAADAVIIEAADLPGVIPGAGLEPAVLAGHDGSARHRAGLPSPLSAQSRICHVLSGCRGEGRAGRERPASIERLLSVNDRFGGIHVVIAVVDAYHDHVFKLFGARSLCRGRCGVDNRQCDPKVVALRLRI